MNILPDTARSAFKQIQYNDDLIKPIVDKIIYHRLTYFINTADLSYLEPFKRDNYINQKSESLAKHYLSNDSKFLVIEKQVFIRKGIATNRYNGGETSILTKTENAQALIKALAMAGGIKNYTRRELRSNIL